ncbi:MAG: Fur family transcriptional regulator [Anaerolineales bacterium]
MSCASEYAPQLRSRGFRVTPQRMAILHVLRHSGKHLSPREVYESAKEDFPRLTEPTVYRTLGFLAKNGFARLTQSGNGHLRYELTGADHHHLVCRVCGDEIEVEHQLLENLYSKMESSSGYKRIDSHVTFFGMCPKCQTKKV